MGGGGGILLKGEVFMYRGHWRSSWNLLGSHSNCLLVVNKWLGTGLPLMDSPALLFFTIGTSSVVFQCATGLV